jgi:hypothetical protein
LVLKTGSSGNAEFPARGFLKQLTDDCMAQISARHIFASSCMVALLRISVSLPQSFLACAQVQALT